MNYHRAPHRQGQVHHVSEAAGKIGLSTASTPATPFAKHVVESLEVLDILVPGLAERAATHVLSGQDEGVLLDLRKVPAEEAVVLLDMPATLGWWHPPATCATTRRSTEAHQRRRQRPRPALCRNPGTDVLALARFGKVLEAACQGANLVRVAKVPDWLIYLVVDALHTTLKNLGNKHGDELRKHWNLDLLVRLLAVDDLPADDALLLILDRRDLNEYHWRDLAGLPNLPGTGEYLLQHPPAPAPCPRGCRRAVA